MFKITTSFSPIRMIAGQKDAVMLHVFIKNLAENSKMASVYLKIPYSLGFDKVGLVRDTRKRIGTIKAGTEKDIIIPIYGKPTIVEGEYPISIKVEMHGERFDKKEQEYSAETKLRVIRQ
jgi:hypothetical protein